MVLQLSGIQLKLKNDFFIFRRIIPMDSIPVVVHSVIVINLDPRIYNAMTTVFAIVRTTLMVQNVICAWIIFTAYLMQLVKVRTLMLYF